VSRSLKVSSNQHWIIASEPSIERARCDLSNGSNTPK
jgi:hypothetical protein